MRFGEFIVFLLFVAMGVGIVYYLHYSPNPVLPSEVQVRALVYTTGAGTTPTAIYFNGMPANLDGNYAYIGLSNFNIYNVTIKWTEPYGLETGYCSAKTIILASTSSVANYTFSC